MAEKIELWTDIENTPVMLLGLYQAASTILVEMARIRENGPWFEELRERAKTDMKNAIPFGISPDKEAAFLKVGIDAVDAVFNRVVFR